MTKNKAFVLIVFFSFLSAVIFYILGAWHSNKVNQQEIEKFKEQALEINQENLDTCYEIISRYIIYTNQLETAIQTIRRKDYIPPKSSPDIVRPSREE